MLATTYHSLATLYCKKTFSPKREEVAEEWRNFRNKELHNLFYSTHIIRAIKSMNIIWAVHVARIGKMRNSYIILAVNPERTISLETET
jgi:hypothetical protein